MSETSGANVRAVERALQILACFDDEHPERGISDIAQAVGLHKATTHRIVTTLLSFGYIERAADGLRYRLGLRLADLGYKVIRRMDLRRESQPLMAELTRRLGETSDLCVYDRGQVLYLEVVQANHALTIAAAVGRSMPMHATASGKVLLAHMAEQEREAALSHTLAEYTPHTITDAEELRRQLGVVRNQGYAVDDEEFEAGIRAVSAPVRNREGTVIAAMSVAGPASRLTRRACPGHRQGTGRDRRRCLPAPGVGGKRLIPRLRMPSRPSIIMILHPEPALSKDGVSMHYAIQDQPPMIDTRHIPPQVAGCRLRGSVALPEARHLSPGRRQWPVSGDRLAPRRGVHGMRQGRPADPSDAQGFEEGLCRGRGELPPQRRGHLSGAGAGRQGRRPLDPRACR